MANGGTGLARHQHAGQGGGVQRLQPQGPWHEVRRHGIQAQKGEQRCFGDGQNVLWKRKWQAMQAS